MSGEVTVSEAFYQQRPGDRIIRVECRDSVSVVQLLEGYGDSHRVKIVKVGELYPTVILHAPKEQPIETAHVLRDDGQSLTLDQPRGFDGYRI